MFKRHQLEISNVYVYNVEHLSHIFHLPFEFFSVSFKRVSLSAFYSAPPKWQCPSVTTSTEPTFYCVRPYLHSLVLCEFRNPLNNSFQMYLTKPAIVPCHRVFVIIDFIGCPIITRTFRFFLYPSFLKQLMTYFFA